MEKQPTKQAHRDTVQRTMQQRTSTKRPSRRAQEQTMKRTTLGLLAALVLVAAVAVGICISTSAGESSVENPSFSAVGDAPTTEKPFSVSLGFIGDISFADDEDASMAYLYAIDSTDITDGIDEQFVQLMNDMDIMWANNEFTYSDRGEPLAGKMYTFRAPTENVKYLLDLGVDIAGLANNHTFDYGEESFLDTLETLENAGIPYVGAGLNDTQAYAPVYLKVNGITIGYVAASRAEYEIFTPEATATEPGIAWCYENDRFLESVREAAENADFVVVLPHWGVERSYTLEDVQIDFAHQYIDAGADIVIGAHPHNLQGVEFYEGKPILYSIGNFWFDGYTTDTAMIEVQINGTLSPEGKIVGEPEVKTIVHPGIQSGMYTSWVDDPDEAGRIFWFIEYISVNAYVSEDGVLHEYEDEE